MEIEFTESELKLINIQSIEICKRLIRQQRRLLVESLSEPIRNWSQIRVKTEEALKHKIKVEDND